MFKLLNYGGRKDTSAPYKYQGGKQGRSQNLYVVVRVKYLESLRIRMSLAIIKGDSSSFSKSTIEVFF